MKKLVLIFSVIFLTACSNEIHSVYGKLYSISEDTIYVECSDLMTKAMKSRSQDDIGYSCGIQITEETIILNQTGDEFTFDGFTFEESKIIMVSVHLEEPVILSDDLKWPTVNAKEIKIFENE